nr:hypothetical protein [Tanacetum cinerariifolium]
MGHTHVHTFMHTLLGALVDYILGPEHVDDEIVAEDQPYAEDALPIAQSPEYVSESDFEAHPEDDDDEDPKEDPVDYLADGGDDGDDEEESSENDEDDDMDVEADEKEEHLSPADSVVVAPTAADQAPSVEETEPFETDESAATPLPHPSYRTTAWISIPAPVPMPAWTDSEITERQLLAGRLNMLFRDRRAHAYTCHLMETEARTSKEAWVRATNASDLVHGEVMSLRTTEIYRDFRVEDSPTETGDSPTGIGDSFAGTGYHIIGTAGTCWGSYTARATRGGWWEDRPEVTLPPRKRQDMDEIYTRLDDEQTERQLLIGQLNMLFRARRAHAYTRQLMETEARMSREAWARATDASDLVHGEVISLRTTVLGQISEIRELQAADRKRQTVISEFLRIDHRRSTETSESRTALQGQITALQGQVTALQAQVTTLQGQQGLAGDPIQPEPLEKAGGSA